jgi:PIN domain nuclease of toxin-antitoxin system
VTSVVDASAILAALQGESGSEAVVAAIASDAVLGTVNLSEVVSKLAELGMSEATIRAVVDGLGVRITGFDEDLAYAAGMLRIVTRSAGLSLGDRECLALAHNLRAEAITADHRWAELQLDVRVRVIR